MRLPRDLRPVVGVAGVLGLIIAWEFSVASLPDDVVVRTVPVADEQASPAGAAFNPAPAVETILARPVFVPDRRPASSGGAATQSDPGLPRLTGIVIDGLRKQAVFQRPSEKPHSFAEGDHIGSWTIEKIDRRAVVLQSPGGSMTVEPAKDSTLAVSGAVTPPAAGLPASAPMPAPMRPISPGHGARP